MSKVSAFAAYTFDVLYSHLKKTKPHSLAYFQKVLNDYDEHVHVGKRYPLFVTWNIKEGKEYELRGCIGTFRELDLEEGLKQFALTAALNDTRFEPIEASELKDLECCVTILRDFEKLEDPLDWTVGEHGVIAEFGMPHLNATFLPDVASDQGWDKETTLLHLARKAGVRARSFDQLKEITVERYQGDKSRIKYNQYMDLIH
ncbi:hypothetical protein TRVA0_010S02696 [Trichomonascus vanleenenianus]|uniref:uncharacterized protein n=1 Tax=Trichomonascus vanleenenianus TaxID=2268995 RepID=UPI003ECB8ADB